MVGFGPMSSTEFSAAETETARAEKEREYAPP